MPKRDKRKIHVRLKAKFRIDCEDLYIRTKLKAGADSKIYWPAVAEDRHCWKDPWTTKIMIEIIFRIDIGKHPILVNMM